MTTRPRAHYSLSVGVCFVIVMLAACNSSTPSTPGNTRVPASSSELETVARSRPAPPVEAAPEAACLTDGAICEENGESLGQCCAGLSCKPYGTKGSICE
jgi:hypothetical protein